MALIPVQCLVLCPEFIIKFGREHWSSGERSETLLSAKKKIVYIYSVNKNQLILLVKL